ncbi:(deoxy)nucleoside triphosphate pyrophosphohydrolase [Litorihabitans aurantiacus]|uniref:(deoxy)nucleoside triphosphate pyrophosphohydrolase n=1 Tax=Litorihabitans aurantiacus TaxID=1930061 RepID=UPI0024E0F016|nr:(deoxy)nucleoside triphosphate pyrophosphohydrolase [Litorihabitans aurantiacus]
MTVLVVAAAILDDLAAPTRLLAARRSAPKTLAGSWEFAGGKVEPGEDPMAALVRELDEELGVEIAFGDLVPGSLPGRTWPIHRGHEMLVWTARITKGEPVPLQDHDELRWLAPADLHSVPWLPADVPIVDAVAASVFAGASPRPS